MTVKAYEVVRQRVEQRGIPNAELARRTHINSELLRRSLMGERNLRADEFVSLCNELDLSLADFAEV